MFSIFPGFLIFKSRTNITEYNSKNASFTHHLDFFSAKAKWCTNNLVFTIVWQSDYDSQIPDAN